MMTDSATTAVIVSAHRWYYPLYRCLQDLHAILPNPQDLIFVDNGSVERLCDWAKQDFPGATILRLNTNSLFTGGYNIGLQYAIESGYDYALILNADTHVHNTNFIEELKKAADRWPKAAFVGPLVYYRTVGHIQKTSLFYPHILKHLLIWLPFRFAHSTVSRQQLTEHEVNYLNGVCVLCRIAALKEVGLMDDVFGGYMEDADWSWRASELGWTSVFTPVPSIIHFEEKSGYEEHSVKTFMSRRNTVLWFLKRGKKNSARAYAAFSTLVCLTRYFLQRNEENRRSLHRLIKSYTSLLSNEFRLLYQR